MDHINLFKYVVVDKDQKEYDIDKILGKQIITHLREFFNKTKRSKTLKHRSKRNLKKTMRKY